jgi:hypothetical protein
MARLLLDLAKIECRLAGLASAAGVDAEVAQALIRAAYYLQVRANETAAPRSPRAERKKRYRAWLRGAT